MTAGPKDQPFDRFRILLEVQCGMNNFSIDGGRVFPQPTVQLQADPVPAADIDGGSLHFGAGPVEADLIREPPETHRPEASGGLDFELQTVEPVLLLHDPE